MLYEYDDRKKKIKNNNIMYIDYVDSVCLYPKMWTVLIPPSPLVTRNAYINYYFLQQESLSAF